MVDGGKSPAYLLAIKHLPSIALCYSCPRGMNERGDNRGGARLAGWLACSLSSPGITPALCLPVV